MVSGSAGRVGGWPFIGGGVSGPNSVQAFAGSGAVKVGEGAVVSSGMERHPLLTSFPLAGGLGMRHCAQPKVGLATVPFGSTTSAS